MEKGWGQADFATPQGRTSGPQKLVTLQAYTITDQGPHMVRAPLCLPPLLLRSTQTPR